MINSFATLSQEDEISIITLDDGKANVFSEEMTQAINDCLDKVPTDSGSLIITGRPGMFSAGFDLKVIASGDVPKIKKMSLSGFKLLSRIFSFPRPVVAACSGHGIALGTFLLCCCDYRIGIKGEFLLGANEMKTNMVIPTPILELIKFRISPSHKYRSILGAEMYQLDKAIDAGLMDQVEEAETLMDAAIEKAKDLATMGNPSYTLTKALFIKDVADRIDSAIKDLETQ